ncbi:PrsW family glutamic-type intramembrane protease [Lachnoclostridium sp. An118]|uniref:PrsW family glutamic-type intramembrane protease n=1 Tax=Lachnoclostridium sp. An118 TaxID=1965547 RepID=UPI002E8E084F|nr:PrsW family glutamic-type intramembrane protease [Lachnoclostridium sp. An118]
MRMSRICPKCGKEMSDTAKFCNQCGYRFEERQLFCLWCGAKVESGDRFCPECGRSLSQGGPGPQQNAGWQNAGQQNTGQAGGGFTKDEFISMSKSGVGKFVDAINDMTGQEGKTDIRLRELVSEVFRRHTVEEREELFISGTKKTTPAPENMTADWPNPWLFARIFLMFLVVFAGLLVMILQFSNTNAIPGAMFIGALIVPFSLVIFFWETNIPRNISIFDVVSIFFIGGVMSLIFTLILYGYIYVGELNYTGAILVGIVEEVGKIVVAGHYVKKRNTSYILNGLLLGACVGAGFAVFETAGYAFSALLYGGIPNMIDVLILRGALAIGGHTLWAAISTAGLVIAKGERPFDRKMYLDPKFLKFLFLVIALHAVWDMPITLGQSVHLVQWVLCAVAVVIVLVLLSSGLRQVSAVSERARRQKRNANM